MNTIVSLNDYLYSGDTVPRIIQRYSSDLKNEADSTDDPIDLVHGNFLSQIIDLLGNTDFLTSQSGRIREFCQNMTQEYPFLAFNFKGRIKSLIRAEEKFNRYILEFVYRFFVDNKRIPADDEIRTALNCFRDLIAYRIVISLPKCNAEDEKDLEEQEPKYLYEIANTLPGFLEKRSFSPELSGASSEPGSGRLDERVIPYYRDYISKPRPLGYRSLHITFFDKLAGCYTEIQLRTKSMDDHAKIGGANHFGYEKMQAENKNNRDIIPPGECRAFDKAYDRFMKLQELDLSKVRVNMFTAYDNQQINDGCGLFRGRQILPFEYLSILP